jgi:hypothetical protein
LGLKVGRRRGVSKGVVGEARKLWPFQLHCKAVSISISIAFKYKPRFLRETELVAPLFIPAIYPTSNSRKISLSSLMNVDIDPESRHRGLIPLRRSHPLLTPCVEV